MQVCVAVLLDNFVNASARDEERAQLRKIEEAKSFKVVVCLWGGRELEDDYPRESQRQRQARRQTDG